MTLCDLHIHTAFCDGKNSPEEMVQAAIKKGLQVLGFSGHCYTFFDESYCMSRENTVLYQNEVKRLKEKYRDHIRILLGIEQDIWSKEPPKGYDYVISSAHYVKKDGLYVPVDESPELLKKAADEHYNGDIIALCEDYFTQLADRVHETGADIIGHFDLVTKFNEKAPMIDTGAPRYISAWKAAADKLLELGIPFEINTGAISRGWRTSPYPAGDIIEYISAKGGRFILSSDSHSADTLLYGFGPLERHIQGPLPAFLRASE